MPIGHDSVHTLHLPHFSEGFLIRKTLKCEIGASIPPSGQIYLQKARSKNIESVIITMSTAPPMLRRAVKSGLFTVIALPKASHGLTVEASLIPSIQQNTAMAARTMYFRMRRGLSAFCGILICGSLSSLPMSDVK